MQSAPGSRQALVREIADTSKLGTRGEGWFLAQLACIAIVALPAPDRLEVMAYVPNTRAWVLVVEVHQHDQMCVCVRPPFSPWLAFWAGWRLRSV